MLSEEGLCATSSLHAEVRSPGKLCSMLKGAVHNYCSLLLFAAGKTGASTAPDIPDMLFPHLPFSASTKYLTLNSEMDLHRHAMTPLSSHACPTKWSQHGPPKLPHFSSCFPFSFPLPLLLCHPPVCNWWEQWVPTPRHRWVVARQSKHSMK